MWRLIVSLQLLCTGHWLWAKDFSSWTKYTQAELVSETGAVPPGAMASLGLKVKLADRWHTYWVNPGDSGTPIQLKFKTSRGVTVERVLFPVPERIQSGPLISFAYSREVLFPIEVQVSPNLMIGDTIEVNLDAEWLVCEDVCIPAFQSFRVELPVAALYNVRPTADFALFQKARAALPRRVQDFPSFEFTDSEARLKLPVGMHADSDYVDFLPFRGSGVTNARAKKEGEYLIFKRSDAPSSHPLRVGLLILKSAVSGQNEAIQFGDSGWHFETIPETTQVSMLWILFSAFLGGLILNLMPCVFPVLSIKLIGVLKLAEAHPNEVRKQNLAYSLGVIVSFIGIALALSLLRSMGHSIGWGFQLQSPLFLSLLSWLFFALTLNLLGFFEFDLINPNWGGRLARTGGLWGSFFTGVLAVVVASPCTAPFMGVALGFGLTQSTLMLVLVFFMLGLGLAFPYLLFVVAPSILRFLPRPGVWMKRFKQLMAVPLFLTTLWLLWILNQVRGNSLTLMVALGCVGLVLCFSLTGWRRTLNRVLTFGLLLFSSAYIFNSQRLVLGPSQSEGLWQPFSEARLSSLKGRNLFVNMTADWCLTCKVNERLVFDDRQVQQLMQKKNVTWIKGDWTERNEEITRFLAKFDRVGVPFYVFYSARHPNGTPLPEVLTKSSFIQLVEQEFP